MENTPPRVIRSFVMRLTIFYERILLGFDRNWKWLTRTKPSIPCMFLVEGDGHSGERFGGERRGEKRFHDSEWGGRWHDEIGRFQSRLLERELIMRWRLLSITTKCIHARNTKCCPEVYVNNNKTRVFLTTGLDGTGSTGLVLCRPTRTVVKYLRRPSV